VQKKINSYQKISNLIQLLVSKITKIFFRLSRIFIQKTTIQEFVNI